MKTQTHYKTCDNQEPVTIGQKVWLYPTNKKHGGSIKVGIVTHMDPPWYFYLDGERLYYIGRKCHIYSTLEAAQKQQALDKAEPQWQRHGKFHCNATPTVIAYLSFMSGIDKKNITAHKTEAGWLHVSWADINGLHKEKLNIGTYYRLKESDLAPLVEKMKAK